MQVTPVNTARAYAASSSSTGSSSTSSSTTTTKKALGQDDFLKLLATQFQQQDPMEPQKDTDFIAQMAQFTSLDQTSTLVQQMTQLSTSQSITAANSYIGRQVTLNDGNGGTVSGSVSAVDVSSGTPQLVVNGANYSLSSVVRVEPAATTATTTTTGNSK